MSITRKMLVPGAAQTCVSTTLKVGYESWAPSATAARRDSRGTARGCDQARSAGQRVCYPIGENVPAAGRVDDAGSARQESR